MTRFASRRKKLRALIRKTGVDALLVTNFTNVTYLTGFTGDDSYLLVTARDEVLVSDQRYTIQLEEECPGLDLKIRGPGDGMLKTVVGVLRSAKVRRLGVEAASMSVELYGQLDKHLAKIELAGTSGLVEQLRIIKDSDEIQRIRLAAEQARRAFEVIRASLTPDQTELEISAEIENQLRRFGAKGCSFPPIVAVGPRAALPHANPSGRRIGESDFVLIDWGSNEGLYVSDLTRVVVTGKISSKLRRVYGVVLKAQVAAIRAIKPGVTAAQVDRVARRIIAKAGFGKRFGHGLGHGIGLEVHEAPRLGAGQATVLKPGMVVTVEPGVYFPGWGGVRIEDDVLITRDGHEVLTSVPKEFEDCLAG